MPRLSVLIPAYNAADTIASALRSTLRALPRDSEIVILDDGSTDRTVDAAERAADGRVRVLSRPNRGVAATLNDLLSVTDSEFIARMDADDFVLPGRFRRQLRAAANGADVVFTTVFAWGSGILQPPRLSRIEADDFGMSLLLTNPVSHPTLLARRSAITNAGGYRKVPAEDYDLWVRLATMGARMVRLAVPGLAYRLHPQQVTASAQWRRSSWESPELAAAFAVLAEQLVGHLATRITSLAIDDRLTAEEKLAEMDKFSELFSRALLSHSPSAQRALRRKLNERRRWLVDQVAISKTRSTQE